MIYIFKAIQGMNDATLETEKLKIDEQIKTGSVLLPANIEFVTAINVPEKGAKVIKSEN